MPRGAHAARTSRAATARAGAVAARTTVFATAVGASCALVSVVAGSGYLGALAAQPQTRAEPAPVAADGPSDRTLGRIEALNRRYDCSSDGLGPGRLPAHAVVVIGDDVHLTTFDEGWAMHVGQLPGNLVSVCAR